ncbi:MAG: PaaI family thioesterase [Alphaproteobacteria bacterium]|nr:thioesterase [Rhodospirillaceae bacterium]MDP6406711.1 PaaI family thioesterase [Alphaproteobacteria bacterium]MDP6623899.1 PaaI family thioesterase [Alphaproteobacteria bacterium]
MPQKKFDIDIEVGRRLTSAVAHNVALGLEMVEVSSGRVLMKLPYDKRLVGNPDSGVLHGGVISSVIDAVSGLSVFVTVAEIIPIATLDLRIDYLKPATPERDLLTQAHCYKLTRSIAFVRAIAYHDEKNDPVATSVSTFMLGVSGSSADNWARQAATGKGS